MIHSRVDLHHSPKAVLRAWCSIDPISLGALALAAGGGLAGTLAAKKFGGDMGGAAPTPPPTPVSAAPPMQQPQGSQRSGNSGNAPSFVGAAAMPSQVGYGSKTLLGQ